MKILGTGLLGLVGSRVIELLPEHEFTNISRQSGVDITNKDQVFSAVSSSDASVLIHFAAKTQVDECEKDKDFGENGEAWKINVLGTEYIAEACKESGKKLILISTDFVFDGKNPPESGYSEEDVPSPINWYGQTKYEGEKVAQDILKDAAIARITHPYRAEFQKIDFVRLFMNKLSAGEEISVVNDQVVAPTFIDDVAYALKAIIEANASGIFHVVGSQWISPYDAALLVGRSFGYETSKIKGISASDFFKNRAPRPLHLLTKNDKIRKLGVSMKSLEEGLLEIKNQLHI